MNRSFEYMSVEPNSEDSLEECLGWAKDAIQKELNEMAKGNTGCLIFGVVRRNQDQWCCEIRGGGMETMQEKLALQLLLALKNLEWWRRVVFKFMLGSIIYK